MLDYVSSINQKRGISRQTIIGLAISCLFHFCLLILLLLFPNLLAGGYYHDFRGFRWGTIVWDTGDTDDDMERWRMVALLEPPERMNMPSPEVLRKYLAGLGEREEGEGMPPIVVSFSPPDALESDKPPLPQIPPVIEDPEVVVPDNRKPGDGDVTKPDAESSGELPEAEPGTGRDVLAAKPDPAPKIEIASADGAPRKIPEGIQPPAPPPAAKPGAAKPDTSKPVVTSEPVRDGIGLFDTGGFPMGEYRDVISARVRARWLRPSNIIGSMRRTTVVFYIDRNGNIDNLRVEVSSGNRTLDTGALGAVNSAAPFPPLPKDFPGNRVGVRMIMVDD